jgi:hypothetical protein
MADFSHFKAFAVTSELRAEYSFNAIEVSGKIPVLEIAPATEANKPYFNALLKRGIKYARQVQAGKVSTQALEDNRENDRELYPLYVVKGWQDVLDAKGKEVPFTQENVREFLSAIPAWAFDDLRNFAGNPISFVVDQDEAITNNEVEDFAGN